jgi:hypothetical protein
MLEKFVRTFAFAGDDGFRPSGMQSNCLAQTGTIVAVSRLGSGLRRNDEENQ